MLRVCFLCAFFSLELPFLREARKRATTVYLPTGIIPMLPLALSAGPMSLVQDGDFDRVVHRHSRLLQDDGPGAEAQATSDTSSSDSKQRDSVGSRVEHADGMQDVSDYSEAEERSSNSSASSHLADSTFSAISSSCSSSSSQSSSSITDHPVSSGGSDSWRRSTPGGSGVGPGRVPAVSVGVTLREDFSVADVTVVNSYIAPTYRLTYDELPEMLAMAAEEERELVLLRDVAEGRRKWRMQQVSY